MITPRPHRHAWLMNATAALSGVVLLSACAADKIGGLTNPKNYQTVQITVEVPGAGGVPTAHMDDCPDLSATHCQILPYNQTPPSAQPLGVRNTIPAGAMDASPAVSLPTSPYTSFFLTTSLAQEGYYASIRAVLAMSSIVFQRALEGRLAKVPVAQPVTFSLTLPAAFDVTKFNFKLLTDADCVVAGGLSRPDYCMSIHLPTRDEDAGDHLLYYAWRQASLYAAADALVAASEAAYLTCAPNCPTQTGGISPVPPPYPVPN